MMSYETDAATRYRQYAGELRVIAEDSAHYKRRDMLLTLAHECVQLAENFEAIERSHQAMLRHRH